MPCLLTSTTVSKIRSTKIGARPSDGSSSSRSFGLRHQRAPDRAHLLLAAGHRPGLLRAPLLEAREEREHALHVVREVLLVRRAGTRPSRGSRDAHAREEPPALGALRDAALHDRVRRRARDVVALEADRPLPRPVEAVDRAQRRGLPGAVRADQRHDLALRGRRARCPSARGSRRSRRARPRARGPGAVGRVARSLMPSLRLPRYASITRSSAWISAGVPSAIFPPYSSTVMRSETPITTFMSCSMRSTVRPFSSRSATHEGGELRGLLRVHARRSARRGGAASGRSRARARPRGVAGRRTGACPRTPRAGAGARSSGAARWPARAPRAPRACTRGVRRIEPKMPPLSRQCMPTSTFSSAVICANSRMFWNVRPMPSSTIACGGLPTTSVAVEHDRARTSGTYTPVIMVEERRLAGAVRPDQGDDRAARDREVDVVGRDEAAELLPHVLGDEQIVGWARHQSSVGSRSVSVPSVWTS